MEKRVVREILSPSFAINADFTHYRKMRKPGEAREIPAQEMVAEKGLEPLLSLRKNGFSYHYGFRHQRESAVCGPDYALIRT